MRVTAAGMALLVSGALAISLAGGTAEQRGGPEKEAAKRHETSSAILKSLPRAGVREKAMKPLASEFLDWGHFAANYPGGVAINVKATAVSVYITDVEWYYSSSTASGVFGPAGDGQTGSGFQYPNANHFGVVMYQPGGGYWQINGTSPQTATRVTGLTNTQFLYFAVNDTVGNYGDNWGSFRAVVRVDAQ